MDPIDLELMNLHISELEARIAIQRRAIDGYTAKGWPTDEGERLLGAFLTSLEQMTIRRGAALGRADQPMPAHRSLRSGGELAGCSPQ
jgi:hypothetical protein